MAAELGPGQHIVCQTCPARVGFGSNSSCDTSKLDGRFKRQPVQCPIPRVVYGSSTPVSDPYKMLRNQLGK